MKTLICILFVSILSGCSNANPEKTAVNYLGEKLQYSDSLLIQYTVRSWHNSDWYVFRDYSKMYKTTNSNMELKILKIFYNNNHTKFICWIGKKIPNAETIVTYKNDCGSCNKICPLEGDTVFSGTALVGFRDAGEIWKIYPFIEEQIVCVGSYDQVIEGFAKYFFKDMKTDFKYVNRNFLDKSFGGEVRYDLEKKAKNLGYDDEAANPLIGKNYGYNLQDKEFWTKSLLWQNGAVIPHYYDFQTKGNILPDDKDFELKRPEITYPENIKKLYK